MMYYIDRPATWKAANKKWEEVQQYVVGAYSNALITDDEAVHAVVRDIRHVVSNLDVVYAHTKPLVVEYSNYYIRCYPKGTLNALLGDKYVFTLEFRPVEKMFSTKAADKKPELMVYSRNTDSYTPDLRRMMMRGGEE